MCRRGGGVHIRNYAQQSCGLLRRQSEYAGKEKEGKSLWSWVFATWAEVAPKQCDARERPSVCTICGMARLAIIPRLHISSAVALGTGGQFARGRCSSAFARVPTCWCRPGVCRHVQPVL
eukprot:365632-Chlamydomonas_euryale.AAC.4